MNKEKIIEKILIENSFTINKGKFISKNIKVEKSHINEIKKFSIITYLKELLKKYNFLYYMIIFFISPVYTNFSVTKLRNKLIKNNVIILNIGSGNKLINSKIINVDLFNYNNVDLIADGTNLPVINNSIDLVINEANLEHIYKYENIINESYRILKKGGICYYIIPFIQGFHASPNDYHRFTHKSIHNHFKKSGFNDIKIGIYSGSASGFLWILIDFLSILFSFGFKSVYEILTIFFSLILWPIKFLDILLNNFKYSRNIASSFYIIAKK